MNTYRVDRVNSLQVPAGMKSVLYIGDNLEEARRVFDQASVGFSSWGETAHCYGVILSTWKDSAYVISLSKGVAV